MVRHVRLAETTDEGLKQLAAADKRTIIGYIAVILERHVEEAVAAGRLQKPKAKGRK